MVQVTGEKSHYTGIKKINDKSQISRTYTIFPGNFSKNFGHSQGYVCFYCIYADVIVKL